MTSRASISSFTRMAPSWAVNLQPICGGQPVAGQQRRQLPGVGEGGEQAGQRGQTDDVEALEPLDAELDPDHRRQKGGDEDGAGGDGQDPAAEGHLGDQAPQLPAVVSAGPSGWHGRP